MKEILLPLLTLILCETTPQPADMHAAITDVPSIADMSHADPKNWVDLPLAVDINEQTPVTDPDTEELRCRRYLEENVGAPDVGLTPEELTEIDSLLPPGAAAGPRYTEQGMRTINH